MRIFMAIAFLVGLVAQGIIVPQSTMAFAQQQKSISQMKSDFQSRFGGSLGSIPITKAPINGVVVCKGGGKRCKCDGWCVANETGCTCDSGVVGR